MGHEVVEVERMKAIGIRVVATLIVSLVSFNSNAGAQTNMNNNQGLNAKEQSIVAVSALTAKGDLEHLQKALNGGLNSGLTVNEVKELLVQLYAYCGFPRSLNGISTLMSVLEDRKKRGITDVEGKTATPINDDAGKYERGRKTLETLTGQPQSKPAKGFGEFSPTIDRFLKEHLFADIFDSDVLNYRQRAGLVQEVFELVRRRIGVLFFVRERNGEGEQHARDGRVDAGLEHEEPHQRVVNPVLDAQAADVGVPEAR